MDSHARVDRPAARVITLRRVVLAAATLWVARRAACEVAGYAGRRWRAPGPPPKDSPRAPGWMPGPFD